MKLLLTSAGIENTSIADALIGLLPKEPKDVKVGFIPTAANVEAENKDWFINQFWQLQQYGFSWIDIVDISAVGINWKSRLEKVDVVYVSGGNTFHLLDQSRTSGFDSWLKNELGTKVYIGASAGSILVTPNIAVAAIDDGDENYVGLTDTTGVGLVDFEVSPHTGTHVSEAANDAYVQTIQNEFYAIDDDTAIVVDGEIVTVVSEGVWKKYPITK